jgi:hypothetical protein
MDPAIDGQSTTEELMSHPPRFQVLVPTRVRLLLPASQPSPAAVQHIQWHRSRAAQAAELEGPWMLRVCVRLPVQPGSGVSALLAARWLGALHVRWLNQMGLGSAAPYTGPVLPAWAAFRARGPGDVVVGTRKVCNVAATASGGQVLLVASTLLQPPAWGVLGMALGRPMQDLVELHDSSLAASMLLGRRVDAAQWAASLRTALQLTMLPGEKP